jgi:enoyl-CoA hydratase
MGTTHDAALTSPERAPGLRQRCGAVLVVTLDRRRSTPSTTRCWLQLDAALDQAEADDGISVLHLRSAHKAFCAGADLALIRSSIATPQGRDRMVAVVLDMQRVFARLENAPCVTMAELGGAAVGGGFELALACDWRIAAHEARIGLPEAALGLLAAGRRHPAADAPGRPGTGGA